MLPSSEVLAVAHVASEHTCVDNDELIAAIAAIHRYLDMLRPQPLRQENGFGHWFGGHCLEADDRAFLDSRNCNRLHRKVMFNSA